MMLAHYHGNIFNASEIANSFDISNVTAHRYLDILTSTFMVRQLQPWFVNIKKRQVKVYFKDSGIFHSLIGITDWQSLNTHPKLGMSWEGFALEEIIRFHHAASEECYFWAAHGAELDLLIIKDGKKLDFEFKHTDSPKTTSSIHIAISDLELDQLTVIYPGEKQFLLTENIQACGLSTYLQNKL